MRQAQNQELRLQPLASRLKRYDLWGYRTGNRIKGIDCVAARWPRRTRRRHASRRRTRFALPWRACTSCLRQLSGSLRGKNEQWNYRREVPTRRCCIDSLDGLLALAGVYSKEQRTQTCLAQSLLAATTRKIESQDPTFVHHNPIYLRNLVNLAMRSDSALSDNCICDGFL
jgi:hypothetical protein